MPKDTVEAVRLLAMASLADNTDAQLEYAIALFNGTGVAKDERMAAVLWRKPPARAIPWRRIVSPISWRSSAACRPIRCWRSSGMFAKAGGVKRLPLDTFVQSQPPEVRAAGEEAAKLPRRHQGDARVTLLT